MSKRLFHLLLLGALATMAACSETTAPTLEDVAVSATLTPAGTPGMIAQYDFNEGSGSVAHDISGNGADAGLFGSAGFSTDSPMGGPGNYSLDLPGNTPNWYTPAASYGLIPEASLSLSPTGLTLAAWVKGGGQYAVILGKQLGTSVRDSFVLFRWGSYWYFTFDGAVGGNQGVGFPMALTADWTHVAGTYDGSTASLYVNGVLVSSVSANTVIDYSGNPVTIGSDLDGGPYPVLGWPGQIDDVEIHDRALTAAEVAQLASTAPPPPPGPTDPTSKDQCKKGGWVEFGFSNQGQCVRFVETGKDSR